MSPTEKPRSWLLIVLGVVLAAAVLYMMWPEASPGASPSNQRTQRSTAGKTGTPAGSLNVRLDALKQPPPQPAPADRNPFRFQPKPPPPPPPRPTGAINPGERGAQPTGPPPPPPIPPIPLKFVGTLEGRGPGKLAVFSDGKGNPVYAHEGELVMGQYRVVRIGVESVVMEYADGRGRQTIPLRGQ
jgi:hypothetical protein